MLQNTAGPVASETACGLIRNGNAAYALEVGDMGSRGGAPRRSWPGLLQPECDKTEQCGLRTAGGQCNTNAACRFND
ncbi:MAG: hypothetical protein WB610_09090, partial [Rhodomicrobium sp.]